MKSFIHLMPSRKKSRKYAITVNEPLDARTNKQERE